MTQLALIRHGETDWNRQGLIQGETDIPLGEIGAQEVRSWRLPPEFDDFRWMSSPLLRARQTAEILSGQPPPTDPRLVEMSWGQWEGRTLKDLRAEIGNLMVAWEAEGLDFRGPDGESPRDVQNRTCSLLEELAVAREPTVAVTHKGVIRAIYAAATGWDMVEKEAEKMRDSCIQLFDLDAAGVPSVAQLNIALEPA